jgi:heme-degrading monooxygenase HmoA
MLAYVAMFQLEPGAIDDLIRVFQDAIAPAAAEQSGFHGLTVLSDTQGGRVMAIGLWQTEADLITGERSRIHQEQSARVSALLAGPPTREVYEVSVHVEVTAEGAVRMRGI